MKKIYISFIYGSFFVVLASIIVAFLLPEYSGHRVLCFIAKSIVGHLTLSDLFQDVDGYLYFASFVNSPNRIKIAREIEWGPKDLVVSSFPKSGTHFLALTLLLILFRGEIPPKTDMHSLTYAPEFNGGNHRFLNEPEDKYPTNPRVILTHMPENHLKFSRSSKFIYIMRDPVENLASFRRMDQLLFGRMNPSIDYHVNFHLHVRKTGWLDHVLAWWKVRHRPNVFLVKYEDLAENPSLFAEKLAIFCDVQLSGAQLVKVVERMEKKWVMANIDPYHFKSTTIFSPPGRGLASKSGFFVDHRYIPETMNMSLKTYVRRVYYEKIRAIIDDNANTESSSNGKTFLEANQEYFCRDGIC